MMRSSHLRKTVMRGRARMGDQVCKRKIISITRKDLQELRSSKWQWTQDSPPRRTFEHTRSPICLIEAGALIVCGGVE